MSYNISHVCRKLQDSLLRGGFLHCQPVAGGPIVEAPILPIEEGLLPLAQVIIVCEARKPGSKCRLRQETCGDGDDCCQYYKGDSLDGYQIIGPGMDEKSNRGWE